MELLPQPQWSENLINESKIELNNQYLYLIVRLSIIGKLKIDRHFDQITVLDPNEIYDKKDLKFARFSDKIKLFPQVMHELLHPISWHLARQIFDKPISPFDLEVELVNGGIYRAFDPKAPVYHYSGKIANFYGNLFQSAIEEIIASSTNNLQETFWPELVKVGKQAQNSVKDKNYLLNRLFRKLCPSKNDSDIILDYSQFINLFPIITPQNIVSQLEIIINRIKTEKYFEGWAFSQLPSTYDYLKLLEIYSASQIMTMIQTQKFLAPKHLLAIYGSKKDK